MGGQQDRPGRRGRTHLALRLAGGGLLIAAGAIHLDLYLTGYRSIPVIGWLFLLQVIAAVVAEASHPAPGRAVTADPAVLAARTIAGVDIGAARRAAADFLSALGIDVDREEMRETPARMARAYAELFSTLPLRLTTFANDEGLRRAGAGPGDPVPHGLRVSPAAVLRPGAKEPPCLTISAPAILSSPATARGWTSPASTHSGQQRTRARRC
jgi:hypothetical protein